MTYFLPGPYMCKTVINFSHSYMLDQIMPQDMGTCGKGVHCVWLVCVYNWLCVWIKVWEWESAFKNWKNNSSTQQKKRVKKKSLGDGTENMFWFLTLHVPGDLNRTTPAVFMQLLEFCISFTTHGNWTSTYRLDLFKEIMIWKC